MYQADPNDNTKQIPKPLSGKQVFSSATTPASGIITANPSYIIINTSGSFAFNYDQTGSLGTAIVDTDSSKAQYTTGSVVGNSTAPFRLDIQPRAWRRTDAASTTGDITFVYRGQ